MMYIYSTKTACNRLSDIWKIYNEREYLDYNAATYLGKRVENDREAQLSFEKYTLRKKIETTQSEFYSPINVSKILVLNSP